MEHIVKTRRFADLARPLAALALGLSLAAAHAQSVDGEVKKVDADAGKVTLKHGAIDNLGMGAMTMTFSVKDKASLKNFREGQAVWAVFDTVDGQPTVVDLRSK